MIDLITGLPGNSKTLYTIAWVREWAKRENRPVFYSGISLTEQGKSELGWTEIKPEEWMDCPKLAIVVIDECQRVFRNRSINTVPPRYVSELETHRHLGIDLVFLTQHPMLIDPAVRRLTQRHRHIIRVWGMERSTIHKWDTVRENCDKPAGRKDSEQAVWSFDKSVYPLYESAQAHTMKRTIPMRAKLLLLVPVIIGVAGWYMYNFFNSKSATDTPGQTSDKVITAPGANPFAGPSLGMSQQKEEFDPVADARNYVAVNTPRVYGLPHTAPKYDEVTKPTVAPVPVSCVASESKCLCYTQQGTRMDVHPDMCRDIVRTGFFQEFDPNGNDRYRERVAQSAQVLDRSNPLPLSGVSTQDRGRVVSFGTEDGYGVLGRRQGGPMPAESKL